MCVVLQVNKGHGRRLLPCFVLSKMCLKADGVDDKEARAAVHQATNMPMSNAFQHV